MKLLKNPVKNAILLRYPTGNIFQGFGENVALYQAAVGINGHNGIDIVKEQGTPMMASEGTVVNVKHDPSGYGKHVRILTTPDEKGDCMLVVYGHLDTIYPNIQVGVKVEDNQIIGTMGNTGFVISGGTPYWGNAPAGKGVHLHFGTRICSMHQTKWRLTMNGYVFYIKDNDNGHKGYEDPMKYLEADTGAMKIAIGLYGTLISLYKKLLEIKSKVA